jgi:hypothetical protein
VIVEKLDLQETKAQQVQQAPKEKKVLKEIGENRAHRGNLELKETREKKVLKEIGENPAHKENREYREFCLLNFL